MPQVPAGQHPHALLAGFHAGLGVQALQRLATSENGSCGVTEALCWIVILLAIGALLVLRRS